MLELIPNFETYWGKVWYIYGVIVLGLTLLSRDRVLIALSLLHVGSFWFGGLAQDLLGRNDAPVSFMAIDTVVMFGLLALLVKKSHKDIIVALMALTFGWLLIHGLQMAGTFPDAVTYITWVNIIYLLWGSLVAWRSRHGIAELVRGIVRTHRYVGSGLLGCASSREIRRMGE